MQAGIRKNVCAFWDSFQLWYQIRHSRAVPDFWIVLVLSDNSHFVVAAVPVANCGEPSNGKYYLVCNSVIIPQSKKRNFAHLLYNSLHTPTYRFKILVN